MKSIERDDMREREGVVQMLSATRTGQEVTLEMGLPCVWRGARSQRQYLLLQGSWERNSKSDSKAELSPSHSDKRRSYHIYYLICCNTMSTPKFITLTLDIIQSHDFLTQDISSGKIVFHRKDSIFGALYHFAVSCIPIIITKMMCWRTVLHTEKVN